MTNKTLNTVVWNDGCYSIDPSLNLRELHHLRYIINGYVKEVEEDLINTELNFKELKELMEGFAAEITNPYEKEIFPSDISEYILKFFDKRKKNKK